MVRDKADIGQQIINESSMTWRSPVVICLIMYNHIFTLVCLLYKIFVVGFRCKSKVFIWGTLVTEAYIMVCVC